MLGRLNPRLVREHLSSLALAAAANRGAGSAASRTSVEDRDPAVWPVDCFHLPTDRFAKLNAFPQDARIRFVESTHKYYIDGKEAPTSVTSVVHSPFPHFDTQAQAHRCVGKPKYAGLDARAIARQWQANGTAAANLGTTMHAAVEVALNTGYWSQDPRIQPELAMARDFVATEIDGRGLEVFRTEPTVFVDPARADFVLPGSVDCLCRDPKTGELWIFDWKRVEKLDLSVGGRFGWGEPPFDRLENIKHSHYSLQLHVYRYILVHYYGFAVPKENLFMVAFHPANTGYRMIRAADVADLVATELMGQFPKYLAKIEHSKRATAATEAWRDGAASPS